MLSVEATRSSSAMANGFMPTPASLMTGNDHVSIVEDHQHPKAMMPALEQFRELTGPVVATGSESPMLQAAQVASE